MTSEMQPTEAERTQGSIDTRGPAGPRADLHVHTFASNKTGEAMLEAIKCPECYTSPAELIAQASARGMRFFAITDHDTIDGAITVADREDVIVGEEITADFPEDNCTIHLLVYGINLHHHAQLQARRHDIYQLAEYIEQHRIAHSVAHPIYRQNDRLERWHVERLLLLFKGFEAMNGAHAASHRDAFDPLLENLSPAEIERLSQVHQTAPRWPEPWNKTRTAGSDDHGGLNIGITYTIFPEGTETVEQALEALRTARTSIGGEPGSSLKLAHAFLSVAVRYHCRHLLAGKGAHNVATMMLQSIVGQRKVPTRRELMHAYVVDRGRKMRNWAIAPFRAVRHEFNVIRGAKGPRDLKKNPLPRRMQSGAKGGAGGLISELFFESLQNQMPKHPNLLAGDGSRGLPPLASHDNIFSMASDVNRDVAQGIAAVIEHACRNGKFNQLFDGISAAMAHQFVLAPYYFALFHQNKERHLLGQITNTVPARTDRTVRVGLFTDTLDDVNGVSRFIRDMADNARGRGLNLTVHTSCTAPKFAAPWRKNFQPLLAMPMPHYADLELAMPPILDVLQWADAQQFDVIHISTPGPMGALGLLAAKMLRVPAMATYHTDFPAYVEKLTGDHRIAGNVERFMKFFYGQMHQVFSRSSAYKFNLRDLGIAEKDMLSITPGVDMQRWGPHHRDDGLFDRLNIAARTKLLYAGRVSIEKNMPLLAAAYRNLCQALPKEKRPALVVAGDGPYRKQMEQDLAGLPVTFLGFQNDGQLAALYASADLFVFPSRTDTLGQVVMEAQVSGLPALVSHEGGPKEIVQDDVTGIVLPSDSPEVWTRVLMELIGDEARLARFRNNALQRAGRLSIERSFEGFWADHVAAVQPHVDEPYFIPAPMPRAQAASV